MKKSKILLIATTLLVLSITAIILIFNNKSGTLKSSDRDFAVNDTVAITKIFLANKDNLSVLLERNLNNSKWIVNGAWDASAETMRLFLTTISRIRVANPVAKSAVENIIKRLSVNATKIEIYGMAYRIDFWGIKLFRHEKMIKCYYIGDVTQDNLGTFMIMDGSRLPFIVVLPGFRGYVASRYDVHPNTWRSHAIFNVNANEIESIQLENNIIPNASFTISSDKSKGKFALSTLNGEAIQQPLDSLKLYMYANSFKQINFEAFISDKLEQQAIDSILQTTPIYKITLTKINGLTQTLKIYPIIYDEYIDLETNSEPVDEGRCYAYLDTGEMVVIQYFTFDKLLKPISFFYSLSVKNK